MRIAVTGAGGFIGSHIAHRLQQEGHDVTGFDVAWPELRREWCGDLNRVTWDHEALHPAGLFRGFEYVMHFAADMGGVGYFHSDADAGAARRNMRMDLNVLAEAEAAGARLFYASSACALPESDKPLTEGLLGGGPADAMYGETKRYIAMLLERYEFARVGIFHTIYGPGQEVDGPRAKFPPAICRKVKTAAATGDPVEIWGDGKQVRTFLYIDDAVEAIMRVAFADEYEGPVNVGSSEEVTVLECADWLCEHAGVEPEYVFRSDKPSGVLVRGCDNAMFDRVYGRRDDVSARDGLAKLYDWIS